MSTYCDQTLTVKGNHEDIKALAPLGFQGYDLTITYNSERKGGVCFDVDKLSSAYPKLIFILSTSIETWFYSRDVYFCGEHVNVLKQEGEENILHSPDLSCSKKHMTGHDEYCSQYSYEDLVKLFRKGENK